MELILMLVMMAVKFILALMGLGTLLAGVWFVGSMAARIDRAASAARTHGAAIEEIIRQLGALTRRVEDLEAVAREFHGQALPRRRDG